MLIRIEATGSRGDVWVAASDVRAVFPGKFGDPTLVRTTAGDIQTYETAGEIVNKVNTALADA